MSEDAPVVRSRGADPPPGPPDDPPRRGDPCMRLTNFLVRDAIIPNLSADRSWGGPARRDGRRCGQAAGDYGDGGRTEDRRVLPRGRPQRHHPGGAAAGTTGHHGDRARNRHPALPPPVGRSADRHPGAVARWLALRQPRRRTGVRVRAPGFPPERPGDHLRALEAVVRTMRDEEFVRRLRACTTQDEIWALLESASPGW